MIKFSQVTTDLIFDVQDFGGRNIRQILYVSILTELTFSEGKNILFNDLIFKAKYLKGLKKISQKDISGINIDIQTANDKIIAEISAELNNLKNLIRDIISNASPDEKIDFENNFFLMETGSLANYYELIEDLAMFKEYFNAKP